MLPNPSYQREINKILRRFLFGESPVLPNISNINEEPRLEKGHINDNTILTLVLR